MKDLFRFRRLFDRLVYGLSTNPFTLDLNLFRNTLPSEITVTRSGGATFFVNGVLQDVLTGVARISEYTGLIVEPSSTNHIRNGESGGATLGVIGSGGVAPTNHSLSLPAGISAEITEAGTVSGFKYYYVRFTGTDTGDILLRPEGLSQVTAASGNRWIASAWCGLVAGTLTNVTTSAIRVKECAAGAELTGTQSTFTPTVDPTRVYTQRLFNNAGTTHAGMEFKFSVSGAVDFTVIVSSFQLESGNYLTSYIRTTSAAVTRNSEFAYILGSAISGYNQNTGTILIAAKSRNFFAGWKFLVSAQLALAAQSRISLFKDEDSGYFRAQTVRNFGTVDVDQIFYNTTASDLTIKAGMAWAVNDFHANVNGNVFNDVTFPVIPPTDRIHLGGNDQGGANFAITNIKYSPYRLSNAVIAEEVA